MRVLQKEKDQKLPPSNTFRFRLRSRLLISAAVFSIIPILFFVAVAQLTKAKGPQWLPYTFENSYQYLFNSLLVLKGQPSPFIMDPGTTNLSFGATILRASTLKSTDDLIEYSLRNPEKQIKTLHRALLIFTALILWIAPWTTALALRNYIAGLLIQAPVLFYQSLLYWGIVFGSELTNVGFTIAVVCCCVLLVVPSSVSEQRIILGFAERSIMPGSARMLRIPLVALMTSLVCAFAVVTWGIVFGLELMNVGLGVVAVCCCILSIVLSAVSQKTLIFGFAETPTVPGPARLLRIPLVAFITGLLCAFGMVTKLVFFPLILISLFCCRTLRNLASFGAAFVLGLAFALAPIYSQLPRLAAWSFDLGAHSGTYGTGPVGLPQLNLYFQSLKDLFRDEPLLVIIPTIATAAAIMLMALGNRQKNSQSVSWLTVLPIFGLQLLSYLVIAKEVYTRYLFPLCLSVGLNLALLFYVFQNARSVTKRVIGSLTLIGLLLLGFKDFVQLVPASYSDLRRKSAEQLRLYRNAKQITKNDVRIDYFFSDSPEYPLYDANSTAGNAFSSLLTRLYPDAPLFFNYASGKLETFIGPVDAEAELQKYDHLYFLGDRDWLPKLDELPPGTFETIDHADAYSLDKWTRK